MDEELTAIPIDVDEVPYYFEIDIDDTGEFHTFSVNYNATHDYYTVDVSKDDEDIVHGLKLTYGVPLFSALSDERLPTSNIVPRDVAGLENRVSLTNLGKTVFLFVEPVVVANG